MFKACFSLILVLAAVGFAQVGSGLQTDIIGLRAAYAHFSTLSIGVMMASYYAGFSLAAYSGHVTIGRFGHARVMAGALAASALVIVLHPLLVVAVVWSLLRFVSGYAFALFDVGVESWINEAADNKYRGRIFSIYMTVQIATIMLAQYILSLGSPGHFGLYIATAVLFAGGLVPVLFARKSEPHGTPPQPLSLTRLVRTAPVGCMAVAIGGVAWSVIYTLGPVFASRTGFSTSQVGLFMGLALAGGAIVQYPAGWLSDRFGRQSVLTFLFLGGLCASLFGLWAVHHGPRMCLLAALLSGGFVFPLYTIAVSWVNDAIAPGMRVPAAAGLLLLFGLGSIIGPLAGAAALPLVRGGGYYVVLIVIMILGAGLEWVQAFLHGRTGGRGRPGPHGPRGGFQT